MSRFSFNTVFSEAWTLSRTMKNIISAFRTTGIHPLDRSKLLPKEEEEEEETLEETTCLAYIPMISPVPLLVVS